MAYDLIALSTDPAKARYWQKFLKRYWRRIEVRGFDECWLTNYRRYPSINFLFDGITYKVQRTHIALFLDGRPRPGAEYSALHSCDVPQCCNPKHLRWGKDLDNADDRLKRRRQHVDKRRILTVEQASKVFSDPRMGVVIAKDYGITPALVSRIKLGKSYALAIEQYLSDAVLVK